MAVVAIKPYVEFKNKGYWIVDTRVSLDSVVYAFNQGLLPESIAQSYPLLDLEKVYGVIAFYLANRTEIDSYLLTEEQAFETMSQPLLAEAPALYEKLMQAKKSAQQHN